MKVRVAVAGLAIVVLLGGCGPLLKDGPVADLPPQPAVTGTETAPTAVVISLPPDIYKTIPPRAADAHIATEAELDLIEDYALHLPSDDRFLLEARVNDCRFTAHDSCTIQATPNG